jgi:ZIP family zinc transporter
MRHTWLFALALFFGLLSPAPALAHDLGPSHAGGEVSLVLALMVGLGAAIFPLGLGTWLGTRWAGLAERGRAFLHGAAAGALVFLLMDFFNLTASLGMGMTQWGFRALLVASVLAGLLALTFLEGHAEPRAVQIPDRTALLWAAGIGFHSLGEGIIMGHNMHQGFGVVFQALPVLSFGLHKMVEGGTAGLLLSRTGRLAELMGIVAVAGLPSLAGILIGFFGLPGSVGNVAYALGAGAVMFVLPKFLQGQGERDWVKTRALGVGLGFTFMYLTGLLHEL